MELAKVAPKPALHKGCAGWYIGSQLDLNALRVVNRWHNALGDAFTRPQKHAARP